MGIVRAWGDKVFWQWQGRAIWPYQRQWTDKECSPSIEISGSSLHNNTVGGPTPCEYHLPTYLPTINIIKARAGFKEHSCVNHCTRPFVHVPKYYSTQMHITEIRIIQIKTHIKKGDSCLMRKHDHQDGEYILLLYEGQLMFALLLPKKDAAKRAKQKETTTI